MDVLVFENAFCDGGWTLFCAAPKKGKRDPKIWWLAAGHLHTLMGTKSLSEILNMLRNYVLASGDLRNLGSKAEAAGG